MLGWTYTFCFLFLTTQKGVVYLGMLYGIYILFSSRMSWNTMFWSSGENRSWNLENVVTTGVVWASTWSSQATTWTASQQQIKNASWASWVQGSWLLIVWVIFGIIIGWLVAKVLYMQNRSADRKLAVQQSKATTLGYVSEKIAPLLPDFPYSYKDLVFLGKGVDYVCFDGLSQWRVKQIVFLEIKTGKSMLNKNELLIKSAIDTKKVYWETVRI